MIQGLQYARAIRSVRLAHEALSQMFLTSAEAFAIKNSLPWLTNETTHVVRDLEQSFGSKDATACATVCQKAEDAIPQSVLETITRFQKEGRQNSATFAYWGSFLESGNILLRLSYQGGTFPNSHTSCDGHCSLFRPCWANELFPIHPSVHRRYEATGRKRTTDVSPHDGGGGGLLFVGQRVGFSIVSLQIKPWNKQSIVKQRAREVL